MLAVVSIGSILAVSAELLLIGHTEDWRQWLPLALHGLSLGVWTWHLADGGPSSTRAVRATMIAFIAVGIAGLYYHWKGSAEFKLEANPALAGWALFWEALRSKNPPSLAPGIMIQIAVLGLAYTHRHPSFVKSDKSTAEGESR